MGVRDNNTQVARVKIPHHLLDVIAHLHSECLAVGDISQMTGVPVPSIVKLFEGGNEKFNQFRNEWRTKYIETSTKHRRSMVGMLEKAYVAVERGLEAKDVKGAADVAFKVMGDLGLGAKVNGGNTYNVNLQQNTQFNLGDREIEQVGSTVEQMVSKTQELNRMSGLALGDFTKHLLKGTEALPTPEAQLKVIDVESLPPVDESPGENFNLTELDPDD